MRVLPSLGSPETLAVRQTLDWFHAPLTCICCPCLLQQLKMHGLLRSLTVRPFLGDGGSLADAGAYRNTPNAITELPMSAIFDTILPQWSPQERIDLTSWHPDAVVINLATNDFTEGHVVPVDQTAFVAAYTGTVRWSRLVASCLYPVVQRLAGLTALCAHPDRAFHPCDD